MKIHQLKEQYAGYAHNSMFRKLTQWSAGGSSQPTPNCPALNERAPQTNNNNNLTGRARTTQEREQKSE